MFWLEMLEELDVKTPSTLQRLKNEANQLVVIIVASKKTSRRQMKNRQSQVGNHKS